MDRRPPTSRSAQERARRIQRAADVAARGAEPEADARADAPVEDDASAGQRLDQQALWVDQQVRAAIARGEFDDLPGAGKPIEGLDGTHDPEWWVKRLIEREQITGVLPPALALRREDAELDDLLDRESSEVSVRRLVAEFNGRVVEARRQLMGGPPVITPTRDADEAVAAWQVRLDVRRERARAAADAAAAAPPPARRWWRRRRG